MLFSLESLADLERVCLCGPQVLRQVLSKKPLLDLRKEVQVAHDALVQECMQLRAHATHEVGDGKDGLLVTGATGFLGAFVAAELLRRHRTVLCLVRAGSVDEARQRLEKSWHFYRLEGLDDGRSVRLLPSKGIELNQLGLAKDDFDFVVTKVSAIIHCAAEVSGVRPYEALRANVIGTQRVLALAWQSGAKVIHVSTMGFLPEAHAEVREVSPESLIQRSGYAQSKWVAEELVWRALENPGVPSVVVRPGTVCGHPVTGATNPQDALSILMLGLVQLGKVRAGQKPQEKNSRKIRKV